MIDFFNKIGERNLLIINIILCYIFYAVYVTPVYLNSLNSFIEWCFGGAGHNIIFTVALIVRCFKKINIKTWLTILVIHWAIQILNAWSETV